MLIYIFIVSISLKGNKNTISDKKLLLQCGASPWVLIQRQNEFESVAGGGGWLGVGCICNFPKKNLGVNLVTDGNEHVTKSICKKNLKMFTVQVKNVFSKHYIFYFFRLYLYIYYIYIYAYIYIMYKYNNKRITQNVNL